MIERARQVIRQAVGDSKNPACLLSFGKDSLLLLFLIRELGLNPTLLWFHDHTPPQAERVITEWNLTVYSYGPAVRYRVGDSIVSEYSLGDARLPVIRDIEEGGYELNATLTPYFNYTFDCTLFGYKASDTHPLVTTQFDEEFQLGPTRMVAPLHHFTDDKVLQMIEDFDIPYEPFADDVLDCNYPVVSLPDFRQRFAL